MLTIKINMEMCRVCFKTGVGTSLLDEDQFNKFNQITGLSASPEDDFPNGLCSKCLSRLQVAFEFRRQSIASENHLINFIAQVNKEFKHKLPVVESECGKSWAHMDLELLLDDADEDRESTSVNPSGNDDRSIEYVKMDYSVKDIIEDESDILQDKDEIMEIEEEFSDEVIERIIEAPPLESYDEVDVSCNASNTDQTAVKSHTESDKIYSIVKRSKNSSEDNHFCIQCKKDFSTKTNLRRHMLTHADQKPFQCSICGNGFTQKGSLKQHMHLHTGERPYKCTFCNDSFTQAKTLVNHIRRHTGEKPFPCPDCGISFRQKDGLKRHMTRHMETQKMYPCTICKKQLYSKYSLDNHIRKHEKSEGIVKLICSTCGCDFLNEKALEDHQQTSDECNQDCKITRKQDRVIINDPSDNSIEVLEVEEESLDSTSQSS